MRCVSSLALALVALLGGGVARTTPDVDRRVQEGPGRGGDLLLTLGKRAVLRYRSAAAPFKPYVKELRTPQGVNVLLDAPPDHPHHHGLMLALGAGAIDFWAEEPADAVGRQVVRALHPILGADGPKGLREQLSWLAPDGSELLREQRELRLLASAPGGPTLLTWRSRLEAAREQRPVRLWGRHYFGLGLRLPPGTDGPARFLHSEGAAGPVYRGDERLTRGRWCAAQLALDGRPVTVALFDHALNPRFPATWFTMAEPFGYLAATMDLERQPRLLDLGWPLQLRHAVAAWDGHVARERVEQAYLEWLLREDPLAGRRNLARTPGVQATASSTVGAGFEAARAVDGRFGLRETDGWISAAGFTPHYLRLDLGQERTVDAIVVRHAGVLPRDGSGAQDTADFRLQGCLRPWGPWVDLADPVRGNSDHVTRHAFPAVKARYLRLLIETSEQGGGNARGRIQELEVYGPEG